MADFLQLAKRARDFFGAPWFTRPWDLNMVVLRSGVVGVWDDAVVLACTDESGRDVVQVVRASSDAWEGEWTNPTHPQGCVYILDQHVVGGYVEGKHKGRDALRQRKPFEYVRWPPDGTVPTVDQLEARAMSYAFKDTCGTHFHNRASGISPDKPRTDDSEGCVVSLYYHQHAAAMEMVRQQARARGSTVVSPTFFTLEHSPWD